ncbi:MAG: RNA polymerase subunit sigma-70 [Cellulosilyticaceae bacterium]
MTKLQKQKIYELRLQGLGYKAIATVLGLSRDSVRSYCKRHHLSGPKEVIKLNTPLIEKNHVFCLKCNTTLTQKGKGRHRKFCSNECRRSWWIENQDKRIRKQNAFYTFTCSYCKKEFEVYGNNSRKYCSHSCYINARFGEVQIDKVEEWSEERGV